MTVIMGCTYLDGVCVAADRLRHDALTQDAAGTAKKFRFIGPRFVAAKAGYGPDADTIWDQVLKLPDLADLETDQIFERLREIGASVYADCCEKAAALGAVDPGLYIIAAGLSRSKGSSIYWLNFGLEDFGSASGPGRVVAYASRPETNDHAKSVALENCERSPDGMVHLRLDNWARSLTIDERTYAPHAIGFPVDLALIRTDGATEVTLTETGAVDEARTRVRIV